MYICMNISIYLRTSTAVYIYTHSVAQEIKTPHASSVRLALCSSLAVRAPVEAIKRLSAQGIMLCLELSRPSYYVRDIHTYTHI